MNVPAELGDTRGEPFLHAAATDVVSAMLVRARDMGAELTVFTCPSAAEAAA